MLEIPSEKGKREAEWDDFNQNNQQEKYWFNGTVFGPRQIKKPFKLPVRQIKLHNQITRENTEYSERFEKNKQLASLLSQFFPHKWLIEITKTFKENPGLNSNKRNLEDKLASYLGFIEIYLNFRNLTILESTIKEINTQLKVKLEKILIRHWKIKILRNFPELKNAYLKNFKKTHDSSFIGTVIKTMNEEMQLPSLTNDKIFQIKHRCLKIAKELIKLGKTGRMKNQEVWARAICIKAYKDLNPSNPTHNLFPELDSKIIKLTENKRWQLDTLIK
ncbi:MAG: hypothetical protein ACTSW1_18805 [Candidatus Hodarchaeales archaeon]